MASALPAHDGDDGPAAEKGPLHVDIDDAIPLLLAGLLRRDELPDPGVVDQGIHAIPIGGQGGVHQPLNALRRRDIHLIGGRLPAILLHQTHRLLRSRQVDVGRHHPGAASGQSTDDGAAESTGHAGDDRCLSCELHAALLSSARTLSRALSGFPPLDVRRRLPPDAARPLCEYQERGRKSTRACGSAPKRAIGRMTPTPSPPPSSRSRSSRRRTSR